MKTTTRTSTKSDTIKEYSFRELETSAPVGLYRMCGLFRKELAEHILFLVLCNPEGDRAVLYANTACNLVEPCRGDCWRDHSFTPTNTDLTVTFENR